MKVSTHYILLCGVLLVGLFLRVGIFNREPMSYQWQPDYGTDYLVAHHIVRYQEFPLDFHSGPGTLTSPLYYYLLAAILLIKDDIVFLGFVSVLLQVATIVVVYLLAKMMFGKETALMTAALFALSESILYQSQLLWQPWIMQPFVNLSYLVLLCAYIKKSYRLLLFSIFIFLSSAALQNSVFAFMPEFILCVCVILFCQRARMLRYIGAFATGIASLVILYSPLLFTLLVLRNHQFIYILGRFVGRDQRFSVQNFYSDVLHSVELFLRFFFVNTNSLALTGVIGVFGILTFLYFYRKHDSTKKIYLGILFVFILFFVLTVASFPQLAGQPLPVRYFTPIFSLFLIVIAELIHSTSRQKVLSRTIEIAALVAVIYFFSPNLPSNFALATPMHLPILSYRRSDAFAAMASEIFLIQQEESRQAPDFFQLRTYESGWVDNFATPAIYAQLENILATQLVKIDSANHGILHMEPITQDSYLFLICTSFNGFFPNTIEKCKDRFFEKHKHHELIKEVYFGWPFNIFLTKKFPEASLGNRDLSDHL